MPRGEPTKVVRLPVWFIDMQQPKADAAGLSLGDHIVKAMTPSIPMTGLEQRMAGITPTPRCTCAKPTLSRVVSNLCTTCHCLR